MASRYTAILVRADATTCAAKIKLGLKLGLDKARVLGLDKG